MKRKPTFIRSPFRTKCCIYSKMEQSTIDQGNTIPIKPQRNSNVLLALTNIVVLIFWSFMIVYPIPLRKHPYSNILKFLQPKKEKISDKNSDIFRISAKNIDCGYSFEPSRQGGSNGYQQFNF